MAFDILGALGEGYSPQEITDYLKSHPEESPSFDITGALKEGYSPAEIVDHLNPQVSHQSQQGTPVLAPIYRGVAQTSAQAANLADDLGFAGVGSDIRGRINQQDLGAPTAGGDMVANIKAGKIGAAIADAPSAAIEQFLPAAAGLAGGLVTGGAGPLAATAGRLGGGAAIGMVTQGDTIARQRAANNGEASPSASDLAVGLGGGAAAGAAGAIGLGGTGGGIGAATGAMFRHAGADALQPQLAALARSVGTNAGAQLASGADSAASAITGLATRGALAGPEAVRSIQAATPAGRTAALADSYKAMSPDQQQRAMDLASAAKDVQNTQDTAQALSPVSPKVAAATAADRYARSVNSLADALDEQGAVPDGGADVIRKAVSAAQSPNLALTTEHLADVANLGLDPETTGLISIALHRINNLSLPDLTATSPGPVESLMRGPAGPLIGGGAGAVTGHGALTGAIAGRLLRPAVGAATGRVGAMLDRLIGTDNPSLLAQGQQAARMLDASGVAVPETMDELQSAIGTSNNVLSNQARLMGLDPAKAPADTGSNTVPSPAATKPSAVEVRAMARAAANDSGGPAAQQIALSDLTSPMPGMDGMSNEALLQGRLLPEWQYGIGKNVLDALNVRGMPQNINPAQMTASAVASLQAKGAFSPEFGTALMGHSGRVVRGLYNLIRNEALMAHGVDMRTLEAQQAGAPLASASGG